MRARCIGIQCIEMQCVKVQIDLRPQGHPQQHTGAATQVRRTFRSRLPSLSAGLALVSLVGCAGAAQSTSVSRLQSAEARRSSDSGTERRLNRILQIQPGQVSGTACSPSGPEICFNGRDDNCNGAIDEACGSPAGLLQFTIAWNEVEADVDLDVIGPDGELTEVGRVTSSGLTKVRDCPGRDNECEGLNVETVLLDVEDDLTRGDYVVKIRLESKADIQDPVSVNFSARLGPKTFAAEVELEQERDERQLTLTL